MPTGGVKSNQLISQSVNHPISPSINQPISQSSNRPGSPWPPLSAAEVDEEELFGSPPEDLETIEGIAIDGIAIGHGRAVLAESSLFE